MPTPFWLQFHHPDVRDLAFAIASPPILSAWPAALLADVVANDHAEQVIWPDADVWMGYAQAYHHRLLALDQQPEALVDHLARLHTTRLGTRFEALIAFWLKDRIGHPFELIGQNIQRQHGTRTIGELDLLVRNHDSGLVEHWELSIKFYLGEPPFAPADWRGLNLRDTLARKLSHLYQHQFAASEASGLAIEQRRAIVKGRLFWPISLQQQPHLLWLTTEYLSGEWSDIAPLAEQSDIHWRRADRAEWFSPRELAWPSQPHYWYNGLYLGEQHSTARSHTRMLRLKAFLPPIPYH